jgi:hypothetical protein
MFQLSWEQFTLRRGEELVRRLVTTPTPALSAAARHYASTNLVRISDRGGRGGGSDSGGRTPFRPDTPRGAASKKKRSLVAGHVSFSQHVT